VVRGRVNTKVRVSIGVGVSVRGAAVTSFIGEPSAAAKNFE
tara:strand:+ start:498 stop:620 length:123 start_codon:yes stop_codon:yes gene_type:complete